MTMSMLLLLGINTQVAAQKHRHTPQQELVDSTSKDAVEAYSDTTAAATPTSGAADDDWTKEDDMDEQIEKHLTRVFTSLDSKDALGVLLVLGVLFIIFVLAPVLIIAALFYFINKNRREKMRLAQMAMQQGQPIPDQLLNEKPIDADDEYQKGMRQCFVGVGLMIFLGYAAGNVGFGIGALVFCIGLGKVFASKTAQKRKNEFGNDDSLTPNV